MPPAARLLTDRTGLSFRMPSKKALISSSNSFRFNGPRRQLCFFLNLSTQYVRFLEVTQNELQHVLRVDYAKLMASIEDSHGFRVRGSAQNSGHGSSMLNSTEVEVDSGNKDDFLNVFHTSFLSKKQVLQALRPRR